MISRLKLAIVSIVIAFTIYAAHANSIEAIAPASQETIPTRTPTPGPTSPTSPTPTPNSPTATRDTVPPPPSSSATNTPIPVTTTPIPPTVVVVTPVGGLLPTAAPCSTQPTIQTTGVVNVRSGPGIEYTLVAQLVFGEVRPIIGRAANAPWWLIQLADSTQGWVADFTVQVQGFTGNVALVTPPPLNGSTPTPGPVWNPTPVSGCDITPLPVSSATAISTRETATAVTNTPTPTATHTPVPGSGGGSSENNVVSAPERTAAIIETAATSAPPTLPNAATAAVIAVKPTPGSAINSATPSATEGKTASSLLPIVGGILIAAGGIGLFILRRRGNA